MPTPESLVKRKVVDALKSAGVWYFFPANNGFGKSGVPDLIACHHGRFIGIEVKSEKGKLTELQIRTSERIVENGGLFFVVRNSDDIDNMMAVVRTVDRLLGRDN
jgi:hypothetical protein